MVTKKCNLSKLEYLFHNNTVDNPIQSIRMSNFRNHNRENSNNRDSVRTSIQFKREEQCSILKEDFLSSLDLSLFLVVAQD